MTGVVLRLPQVLRLLHPRSPRPPGVVHASARPAVLSTAETAECTCPEFCERDHDAE